MFNEILEEVLELAGIEEVDPLELLCNVFVEEEILEVEDTEYI